MASRLRTDIASFFYSNRYAILMAGILIGYALFLPVDIMEIDAAQYASIAREMHESGHYLQVFLRGQDYLDKPPLLFWITSIPIGLFGPTSWAYKLLPLCILVLGLYATFRFAAIWYGRETGIMAMLITASTQAFYLMANDVRTDGLLTSWIMITMWQLSCFLKENRSRYLWTSGLGLGLAMLTKGPIGLAIPALAFGGHMLIKKQWVRCWDRRWWIVVVVVAGLLAPMCYGLYTQFDLHPEKEVYGLHGPSGIGFFFWTQSFGRITGDNPFNNHTPWYYLGQTMLWDFQPWILLLIPAVALSLKSLFRRKQLQQDPPEWMSLSGLVLPFIALSWSAYKLPHYIFPLFPFAAVLVADFVQRRWMRLPVWMMIGQDVIIHVFMLSPLLVMFWMFPVQSPVLPLLWLALYGLFVLYRFKISTGADRWVLPPVAAMIVFQTVLAIQFYPNILQYQSESQVGRYIRENQPARVYWHDRFGYALDYYSDRTIPNAYGPPVDTLQPGTWIWVSGDALPTMPPNRVLKAYDDFQVTKINFKFLNPKTRPEKLRKMYLIELVPKP